MRVFGEILNDDYPRLDHVPPRSLGEPQRPQRSNFNFYLCSDGRYKAAVRIILLFATDRLYKFDPDEETGLLLAPVRFTSVHRTTSSKALVVIMLDNGDVVVAAPYTKYQTAELLSLGRDRQADPIDLDVLYRNLESRLPI